MGIHRGHKARPLEWLAEKFIFGVSLSAILVGFLIFLFVAREALPIFLGRMNSALVREVILADDLKKHSEAEIRTYLGLTPQQFAQMDKETLTSLMGVRVEEQKEIPQQFRDDKDARLNTTQWRHLLLPHQWTGYAKPEFIWQPVG